MTRWLAVFLMKRAARWSRHPWLGEAMLAEYQEADADGHGLRFAVGCLWASVTTAIEGRQAFPTWLRIAVAILFFAPFALFELGCSWSAIRFIATGHEHYYATLMQGSQAQQAIAEAYRRATPLLTFLLIAIAACQAALVWLLASGRIAAARQLVRCTLLCGLLVSVVAMTLGMHSTAYLIYLGIPLAQWAMVRWMDNRAAR
ncbi:hypothetical protein KPL74_20710 [Bacillus sp. NP157]|nr:hypothetical protein KPL74_20710 [Bacillus sp. NP157]